jgi:hypothetical protein
MSRQEDELQHRLQSGEKDFIDSLYKSRLSKFKKSIFEKMAQCYEDSSNDGAESCTRRYYQGLEDANKIIQKHMADGGGRLERCLASCQDEVSDTFPDLQKNQKDLVKAKSHFLSCSSKCADKYLANLKVSQKAIENDIDKIKL